MKTTITTRNRPWDGLDGQEAYFAGMRAAVPLVAMLAPIYEGQSELSARITTAALGQIDVLENVARDPDHYSAPNIATREADR